jgi:hypothetical protein
MESVGNSPKASSPGVTSGLIQEDDSYCSGVFPIVAYQRSYQKEQFQQLGRKIEFFGQIWRGSRCDMEKGEEGGGRKRWMEVR